MKFIKSITNTAFVVLFMLSAFTINAQNWNRDRTKPNIIYILADDLGYAEIGAFGQKKIETPNLDDLAKNGMIFTQHYTSAPVCAPARYHY